MQIQYKVYNSSSTISYANHMIIAGLLVSSSLAHPNQTSFNTGSLRQAQFVNAANQTAIDDKTLAVVKDAIDQQKIVNFDFLCVDEKLDQEIDRYFANYNGRDKEILDI